jgi:hypothetical protein
LQHTQIVNPIFFKTIIFTPETGISFKRFVTDLNMQFDPNNPIVKLCLQGIHGEDTGKAEDAKALFLRAWQEATNEFEKFMGAFYLARHQNTVRDKIKWLETTLKFALKINDETVKAAFPSLYKTLAECYDDLGEHEVAKLNHELALSSDSTPFDLGPFYHGTKVSLQPGDLLTPGGISNYKADLKMNHIYFTANVNSAGLAAALAKGNGPEYVYNVEPTGVFENDPNVTNKKFPGNPTRSYRTETPLKIVGEEKDWVRQSPENIQLWREKLSNNTGEIIN